MRDPVSRKILYREKLRPVFQLELVSHIILKLINYLPKILLTTINSFYKMRENH